MAAPSLQPEHDLSIEQMKLENTLRHVIGEPLVTHVGDED
jgi:myo-inositol-1-phosphate synthase